MNDNDIHNMYSKLQNQQIRKNQALYNKIQQNQLQRVSRDPTLSPRWNQPSARSRPFSVGEGLITASVGQRVLLSQFNLPAQHSGVVREMLLMVLTEGASNSIAFQLRINGMSVNNFNDFVGLFNSSNNSTAMPVNVFLIGSETLGTSFVSAGGSPEVQIPTCALYAINNYSDSVVLQGRLVGYSFPVTETPDEFGAY